MIFYILICILVWVFKFVNFNTVVRPNSSPWPYRTGPNRTEPNRIFSSEAYRFDGSPFTVPFFIFFRKARAQPLEAVNITVFWLKSVNRTVAI